MKVIRSLWCLVEGQTKKAGGDLCNNPRMGQYAAEQREEEKKKTVTHSLDAQLSPYYLLLISIMFLNSKNIFRNTLKIHEDV